VLNSLSLPQEIMCYRSEVDTVPAKPIKIIL
jgi:hypothetical protein